MFYTIKDVCYCFIYTYVAIYVTYMYSCYYEEKCIKENEEIYKQYTENLFYFEIFYMVHKYNPSYKRKNGYNAYNEAKKLYKENLEFRIECYKKGLKPRLLKNLEKY
jgi:hypothetical protein